MNDREPQPPEGTRLSDHVARELANINRLEAAAWEGWERSCLVAETTKVISDGDKQRAERTNTIQAGDPKFLERVQWCINKRLDLLGLTSEMKKPEGDRDADEVEFKQRRSRALAIIDRLREQARPGLERLSTRVTDERSEDPAS